MAQRNHAIKVRMNDEEYQNLMSKVQKSKMSRERFIRECIRKSVFAEPPNIDYYKFTNALNRYGNLLNQALRKSYMGESFDSETIQEVLLISKNLMLETDKRVRGT